MSDALVYQAAIFTHEVNYMDYKGKTKKAVLNFALDPVQLLEIIASVPTNTSKSNNPSKKGQNIAISDEQQIKLVRDLAAKAAGWPSDDGETWEPFADFQNQLAGKAFMTLLVSSDQMRKDFADTVFLEPFRAYVSFAAADPSNTPKEIQQMQSMLAQLENTFSEKPNPEETLEEKRARLAADLAALDVADEA